MSTGDKSNNPDPFTIAEANIILALPSVAQMMKRSYTLNSSDWDIPYLAGYSQDGSIIFIDRDLAGWPFRARTITCNRFLELHEHVEKSLIDAIRESEGHALVILLHLLRMKAKDDQIYYHCHGVATAVEEYAVKLEFGQAGLDSYNRFMQTQIKHAEDERIRHVPSTLDMTPYGGADRMDRRLRAKMELHMA